MDKLFESYTKRAAQYLNEDDEELDDVLPGDEDTDTEDLDGDEETGDEEEVLELDLANPVCPSCGAVLVPVGEIDTEEEDEDGNPIYDEDEADAIDLLQGLGYVVYKPVEEDVEDDEDLDDVDDTDDDDVDVDDVEDEDDDF